MSNGTIIIGSLDDKELMSAINKLAKDINTKMGDESSGRSTVVGAFASGIKAMEDRLVKFNQNAGKTVESIKKTFTELGVTYDELAKAMQKAANIDLSALEAKRAKAGARDIQGKPTTNFELEQLNAYYRELERVSALEAKRARNEETLRRRGYADRLTAYGRMPEGDLTNAEEKLRKLLALKNDLRRDPLLSLSQMQQLDNRIQKTINKVRELRAALAITPTPTMGSVMGMSEKTLDEIARKMQAIRSLRSGLNYQTQAGDINRLNAEYTRLNQLQNQILGQNLRIESSNNALARSFGYIRNRIVYALTLGAATSFVKQLYDIRGQYELLERSLGVLTNSFQKGRQIFQELNEMAVKSPFTLIELAGAAKQLTAYNFKAEEVVETTRRLADISAALGVPMERLTYNLGQIRAQTVLTARDARDFANAGLPMVKSLADYYSELEGRVVSTGDVYERMSKKMVSYSDVMAVINKMTDEGGKFFDFQAKQADTLKVQIANLSLAWNNMLNEMGESNQDFLALPIKSARALFQNWKEINRILTDVAVVIGLVKAAQIALNLVYGKGNAAIKSQILLSKQKKAIDLDKKALTEQLTASEERLRVTRNSLTAADYRAALAGRNLTKQQALLMVSLDRNNMALKKALIQLNILTAAEIRSANAGTVLKTAFQSLGLTLKGLGATLLSSLPMLAVTAAIGGIVHLVQQYSDNAERLKEMNESLAESAKESADSLEKFLSNAGNKTTKELAKGSLLTDEQGAKAWEAMSEEMKNSAASAESLLFTLAEMKRDGKDINAIITEGFEKLESIRDVQEALQDLDKSGIMVSQTLFGGLFGKGLGDAAEDFNDKIKNFKGRVEDLNAYLADAEKSGFRKFLDSISGEYSDINALQASYANLNKELNVTTQSIADYIKAQNITDPAKITEIIEQARKAIKSKTPQLKGDIAKMFDIEYDKQLAEKLKMPVIETASMWNVFMEELKKHRSEFGDLTDEIYTDSAKLSKLQQQAIMATLEDIKKNFPQYYKDIQNIIDNDKPSLYLHVGLTFGVQERNDIQKMFDEDFPEVKFKFARPQAAEKDLMSYGKRVTETINSNEEALEKAEKQLEAIPIVQAELYNNQLKYINSLKSENEILKFIRDAWHLIGFEKDKSGGGSKKDVLGDAIKKEIAIISDMQKTYKEYQKIGVDSTTAIKNATDEYGRSLGSVNSILRKFGLKTLSGRQIATMQLQDIRDFYQTQLDSLTDLRVKSATITYDAAEEEKSEIEGVSKKLIEQTKLFEGFAATAYKDTVGILTVGYGHSAKAPTIGKNPITEDMVVTEKEAHDILIEDYKEIKKAVDNTLSDYRDLYEPLRTITASQYESLLDFAYQYGAGGLKKLLSQTEGDIQKIGEALGDTTLVGMKNFAGRARREWRQAMFEGRAMTIDAEIKEEITEMVKSAKSIEALEKTIKSLNSEITKDSYKKIIDGLNNELSKVKDEYELGVELDASPELGQAFADIFKIDIDQLPRTVYDAFRHVEHAVQGALSKLGIKDSFNVMTDSLEDFAKKYERDLGSNFISAIKKVIETIRGMWKKETSDTIKDWNNLLNKYGDFQTKLMKISKDSAKEQLSIIKRFGSTEDKSEAQIIVDNISISQDPAQIEVLRKQLLDILNKVVTDKDVAIKIKTASSKEESSLISKAYWEDFKNSELYSMTFEEMGRVSTRAIKDILAQLDILKDKVKEDPASMKALMDAYKKGRDELEKRSPFMAIGESLKEWAEASKEVKAANVAYTNSVKKMNAAESELQATLERNKMLQSMGEYGVSAEDIEETAEAQEKFNNAKKEATDAQEDLTNAENNEISAQTKFQSALKNSASALQSIGSMLSTVTELMGVAEDSELGVMVNSLIGGFQTMATVLGVVATMAELVQLSFGWIGIVMVALSALIGVLTYVSKLDEMAINNSIKTSELKVKRLQLAYKELEYAIEDAYGTARIESQKMLKANKELQLAELKRQLQLEKSRDAKKFDEDKVIDLTEQITDLEHEIDRITKDAVNDLLGISSIGDAAEGLMSSFIEALRNGEDAMASFNESIDDMIANMVMKLFSTKILTPWFDKAVKQIEDRVAERSKGAEEDYKKAMESYEREKRYIENGDFTRAYSWAYSNKELASYWLKQTNGDLQKAYLAFLKNNMDEAYKSYLGMSEITLDDIIVGAEYLRETQGAVEESQDELRDALERLGLIKSQTSQNLSNLTQGIEGITESTAESINAYLNGISQQVYLENSQLAEIKEYLLNFNCDIQLATLSQMLLQLQTNYQVMQTMSIMMGNWTTAAGNGIRVELLP